MEFSYGRELSRGFAFEMSYIGRAGRDLLTVRDVMHLNNLVDTRSGVDWYTAAGMLADLREKNTSAACSRSLTSRISFQVWRTTV